jgi:hypothetical protein
VALRALISAAPASRVSRWRNFYEWWSAKITSGRDHEIVNTTHGPVTLKSAFNSLSFSHRFGCVARIHSAPLRIRPPRLKGQA